MAIKKILKNKVVISLLVGSAIVAGGKFMMLKPDHVTKETKSIINTNRPMSKFVESENFYNKYEQDILFAMHDAFDINDISKEMKFEFLRTAANIAKKELLQEKIDKENGIIKPQEQPAKRPDFYDKVYESVYDLENNKDVLMRSVGQMIEYKKVDDMKASGGLYTGSIDQEKYANFEDKFMTSFFFNVSQQENSMGR